MTPSEETEVLFPDAKVTVRDPDTDQDVEIEVREFRMLDGMKAQVEARALIAAFADLVMPGEDGSESTAGTPEYDAVIGNHPEEWLALLARSTGRDAEWLGRLDDGDGRELSQALWEVNTPFFVRRILAAVRDGMGTRKMSALVASSGTSSRKGTDATRGKSRKGSRGGRRG
ncbi:MAG: hypothetical protein F4187_03960 [Gemmatimonadetes bacterium]|nr:hypothetical protein [Acidobacteriota bacterium]MYG80963.1 hypothetical protein [Gemmatimonadota bacterium]